MSAITRRVKMKLTESERELRIKQLNETIEQHDLTDTEAKSIAAGYKKKIGDFNTKIRSLNSAIKTGHEDRDVECYEEPNVVRQIVHIRRCDTHEIVDDREMSEAERQKNLFPRDGRVN